MLSQKQALHGCLLVWWASSFGPQFNSLLPGSGFVLSTALAFNVQALLASCGLGLRGKGSLNPRHRPLGE